MNLLELKQFVIRSVMGLATTVPAITVNYTAVFVLLTVIHFHTYYVLSAVLVGDIIGFGFNNAILTRQVRFLKRFESFRVVYESRENNVNEQ